MFRLHDVGLQETAGDEQIAEAASNREAIIVTENKKDFTRIMRERASRSGGPKLDCRDGRGVLRVSNGARHIDLLDIARRMKLNGILVDWEDVGDYNLCVNVGRDPRTVSSTPMARCATCLRQQSAWPRARELGLI